MIPLLPKWVLPGTRPSFYDTESGSLQELVATLHGTVNNIISEYNKLEESVNKTVSDLLKTDKENHRVFETGIRQEFQDFINIVDLTVKRLEIAVNSHTEDVRKIATDIVNNAVRDGNLYVTESYDADKESLSLTITGGA